MQSKSDLLAGLKAKAVELGLTVKEEKDGGFVAEVEAVLIKWALGKKSTVFKMSVTIGEAGVVKYRDMVKERSWGLLPPTLTVEKTTTSGWTRSGTSSESAPGAGGGKVDYGKVRNGLQAAATAAGWQFELEGGRAP